MSYNFKKIMDLELVTEVPEGANVLIETDGATKRLPSTAIKPAPIQPDMAQNDPTAPDYVKNRTHYEETVTVNEPLNITWDGNTEGLVSVDDGYGTIFCKVSDATPTIEQLENGGSFIAKYYEDDPYLLGGSNGLGNLSDNENVALFLQKDNIGFAVAYVDGASISGMTIPEKGLYFTVYYGYEEPAYILSLTTTEPVENTKTVVKKLDKKFLPDDIGGGEQYIRISGDTITDEFWCNMSFEAVCNLCFNEHMLPVMGVLDVAKDSYYYLTRVIDLTSSLPTGYVKLLFDDLVNAADRVTIYYTTDGVITSISPGGK